MIDKRCLSDGKKVNKRLDDFPPRYIIITGMQPQSTLKCSTIKSQLNQPSQQSLIATYTSNNDFRRWCLFFLYQITQVLIFFTKCLPSSQWTWSSTIWFIFRSSSKLGMELSRYTKKNTQIQYILDSFKKQNFFSIFVLIIFSIILEWMASTVYLHKTVYPLYV